MRTKQACDLWFLTRLPNAGLSALRLAVAASSAAWAMYPDISLDDARQKAGAFRRAAKEGRDARVDINQRQRASAATFDNAFEAFFAIKEQQLSNGKHRTQWRATMNAYVLPHIGRRSVAEISAAEVLALLQPIWFSKPETASRVLQRIKVVFDSAILRGTRERANPCTGIVRELGTDHRRTKHHAALPWQAVPAFVQNLRHRAVLPATRLLFTFLILTVARSGEARGALWQEFDLERRVWVIPGFDPASGRRMKTGQTHIVPLSDAAVAILKEARSLHAGPLVFSGTKAQPLSDGTLSKLMRDAGVEGTSHGFRSSFKDWCAETGVRDEVSEATLAHTDANRVRAAYRRTDYLSERGDLMQRWASFVSGADNNRTAMRL